MMNQMTLMRGGNSGDKEFEKVVDDDDIDRVSKSSCMCGDDFVLKKPLNRSTLQALLLNLEKNNIDDGIIPASDKVNATSQNNRNVDVLFQRTTSMHIGGGCILDVIDDLIKMDGEIVILGDFNEVQTEQKDLVPILTFMHSIDITEQNGLMCMKKKLQLVENSIKIWSKYNKRKLNEAKFTAHNKLMELDKSIDQGHGNDDILNQRTTLMKELNDINSIDVLKLTQKSKVCWSIEGVKVGAAMSRLNSWNEVIDKISSMFSKWKLKPFYRSRLTLLKSVLTAIPLYHMSLFKAHVTVIKCMEYIRRDFLMELISPREK
nr:hypothetical protein [Tanacetum cinerariifolium]